MPAEGISENNPLSDEQRIILTRLQATFNYLGNGDTEASSTLRPWLQWQNREMLKRITLDHYTTSELISLAALNGPVFSRLLVVNLRPEIVPNGGFRVGLHLV